MKFDIEKIVTEMKGLSIPVQIMVIGVVGIVTIALAALGSSDNGASA